MGEKSQLTYLLIYLLTYLLTPYSCILYGYCFKESINAIQYKAPAFVTVYFYPTNKHKTLHNPTEVFPYKRRRGELNGHESFGLLCTPPNQTSIEHALHNRILSGVFPH